MITMSAVENRRVTGRVNAVVNLSESGTDRWRVHAFATATMGRFTADTATDPRDPRDFPGYGVRTVIRNL
jgi:hypothetical protein